MKDKVKELQVKGDNNALVKSGLQCTGFLQECSPCYLLKISSFHIDLWLIDRWWLSILPVFSLWKGSVLPYHIVCWMWLQRMMSGMSYSVSSAFFKVPSLFNSSSTCSFWCSPITYYQQKDTLWFVLVLLLENLFLSSRNENDQNLVDFKLLLKKIEAVAVVI